MMRCIVFRYKEDAWYLEQQREAIERLYGVPLLVASHPDAPSPGDVVLEHREVTTFPTVFLDAARQIIERFPEDTLFFEGDMVPLNPIEGVPAVRDYCGTPWPSVLFTGNAKIDTSGHWLVPKDVIEPLRHLKKIPFQRFPEHHNFEVIGARREFLHPQAGGRGYRDLRRLARFKKYCSRMQKRNTSSVSTESTSG